MLLLAFESADHALDAWMARALECCRDHGGSVPEGAGATRTDSGGAREGAAGAWRQSFLGAPYLRDALVGMGMISETFETAITWDRFEAFHAARHGGDARTRCSASAAPARSPAASPTSTPTARRPTTASSRRAAAAASSSSGRRSRAAASDARARATAARSPTTTPSAAITGRWYDRQRPDGFADALRAAKRALDPAGILNPGVLIDP